MKSRANPEDFATVASPPEPTKDSRSAGETQELRALSVQEIELRLKGEAPADTDDVPLTVIDVAELEEQAEISTREIDLAVYQEYVRGFDDVPTLHDAVVVPPRPPVPPDFRRGERPNQRKEPRLDAQAVREAKTGELEQSYREYEQPGPPPAARKKSKSRKPRKSGKRKKR